MARADFLHVEYLCSPAQGAALHRQQLQLPAGSCAMDGLRAAGWLELPPGACLSIWNQRVGPEALLRDGDRLMLLRPLVVDPMEGRRRRHAHQKPQRASRHRPG